MKTPSSPFFQNVFLENFKSHLRVPKLFIWVLSGWWRCLKVTLQTTVPERFSSCRWGAERRVKRAQTRKRGPPSAWADIIQCSQVLHLSYKTCEECVSFCHVWCGQCVIQFQKVSHWLNVLKYQCWDTSNSLVCEFWTLQELLLFSTCSQGRHNDIVCQCNCVWWPVIGNIV